MLYGEQLDSDQQNEVLGKYDFLNTKSLIPDTSEGIVYRKRLLERLNGASAKKLTIVQAPAGFGKTVLVSSWLLTLRDRIHPAWLSLDGEDNDTGQFWYNVVSSADRKRPGHFSQPLSMLQSVQPYPVESVLKAFINLLLCVPQPVVLVLDDYHFITSDEIRVSMEFFLRRLPENVHVVLATRMMPSLALSRMRVNSELMEIKADELRFSDCEISAYINGMLGMNMDRKELTELENKTEGWIAVLKIAALSMKECGDRKQFISEFDGDKPELLEYLSEEIINQFPENIKLFLYRTCILDVLNRNICQALTKMKESHHILEILARNNLFLFKLDEGEEYYKYHRMMAGFLRDKMSKQFPDLMKSLYLEASRWYEENEHLQEALDYSVKSENHSNTARLIEKYGERILITEDHARFLSAVEKLPAEFLLNSPRLCILYAFSFARMGLVDKEESILHEKGICMDHERFGELGFEVALVRSTAARHRADMDIEAVISYAEAALKQQRPLGAAHILAFGNLGNVYAIRGELKKAESYFRQGMEASKKSGNFHLMFRHMHDFAQIQIEFGMLQAAAETYESAIMALNRKSELVASASGMIYLGMGQLCYEQDRMEEACAYIKKGIELSEMRKDLARQVRGYITMAKIMRSDQKYGDVLELVNRIEKICIDRRARFILLQFFAGICQVLLLIDQTGLVEELMDRYGVCVHDERSFYYEGEHIAIADYYVATGRCREADALLDTMLYDARRSNRVFSILKILLLKALASKSAGKIDEACAQLHEAVCLGVKGGFIRIFVDHGQPMKELLLLLVDYEREKEGSSSTMVFGILKLLSHFDGGSGSAASREGYSKCFRSKEIEILKYLVAGYSNKEIADALFLSVSSVKKYVNHIFEKLNVKTRAQAIAASRHLHIPDAPASTSTKHNKYR